MPAREDEQRAQAIAELCRMAGADEAPIGQWADEGPRRGRHQAQAPGQWTPGNSVPSRSQLAERFGIARETAACARLACQSGYLAGLTR